MASTLAPANTLEIPKSESGRKLAVERGHHAFYTYGCWHCHAIGDEEAPGLRNELAMGPDMADVGNRLGPGEILQSILEPSAVIAEPREQHMADGISMMPAFNDPQAKQDIRDIVLFLHQCRLPDTAEPTMIKVTDENFGKTVGNSDGLVLLDFWAEWCFACLELNPVLEELAPEYQGRIQFCKVEVDENPVLVEKYVPDLMFPCLVIMKDGNVIDRKYGVAADAEPDSFLQDWFDKLTQ
ncbi:MAG: c-type cytochrome [Verrucomicrobia bacterium]|nr:c-type cytochrome [Verrucomicrobiota bacterium]